MSKNRIKIALPQLNSRDEAEAAMNELALAVNNQRKLIARRDAEVLAINSKYEHQLGQCDAVINQQTDLLHAWADAHPDAFPKGRKSIEMLTGTLGFRTGTPKLSLLNRSWNWQKVLARVQQLLPNFIRSVPEIDKEAILAQRDELKEFLPMAGMKVTQDESFYVEPNLTQFETRQTMEA